MPEFTKIESMLRDGPVLNELRALVGEPNGIGLPNADALGIDRSVLSIVEEPPAQITAALSTRPVSESVVSFTGRPCVIVQGDTFELPALRTWRSRLQAARSNVERALPSVGRIELYGQDGQYFGTGWMVGEKEAITNRHVAQEFAEAGSGKTAFKFRTDLTGRKLDVRLDFREEYRGLRRPFDVTISRVLHIEAGDNQPDFALVQVKADVPLPPPISLGDDPEPEQFVAVVGYPAHDPEIPADVSRRIFGDIYDVKRLSPGQIIASSKEDPRWSFSHDCTTLGGNSGSVVLDLATGSAVGLHFAGAYRRANYAVKPSQLKRLLKAKVTAVPAPAAPGPRNEAAKPKRTVAEYSDREGFDPKFLGNAAALRVSLPGLGANAKAVAPVRGSAHGELRYHHFSTVQHADRRLPLYTAVNIDGNELKRLPRPGEHWDFDPRIAKGAQVGGELYTNNNYDRGHMVRRLDPVWGPVASVANDDTFHWTNCCPQHHDLNTKTWNDLEDYILDNADTENLRVSVLTGPVLADDDPEYRTILIPQEYWKIVAFRPKGARTPSITAYMLSQANLAQPFAEETAFVYGPYRTYQVLVSTISERTGLDFKSHSRHDPLKKQEGKVKARRIDGAADLVL